MFLEKWLLNCFALRSHSEERMFCDILQKCGFGVDLQIISEGSPCCVTLTLSWNVSIKWARIAGKLGLSGIVMDRLRSE